MIQQISIIPYANMNKVIFLKKKKDLIEHTVTHTVQELPGESLVCVWICNYASLQNIFFILKVYYCLSGGPMLLGRYIIPARIVLFSDGRPTDDSQMHDLMSEHREKPSEVNDHHIINM